MRTWKLEGEKDGCTDGGWRLADTVYRDCSLVADEPWPKQKEMFKEWVDEAWWHAPSMLILDNLDKMVTAEQEVS